MRSGIRHMSSSSPDQRWPLASARSSAASVRESPSSSSSTQMRSTLANMSASPCARNCPSGPAALILAAVSIHCCERTASALSASASTGLRRRRAHERAHGFLVRREQFQPAHQHVEQLFARGFLRHLGVDAGEHRSVDVLDVGGERSQTSNRIPRASPQATRRRAWRPRQARSARTDFSASSARKASTILSPVAIRRGRLRDVRLWGGFCACGPWAELLTLCDIT